MKNLHQIREISTLSFNERVLQEAEDKRNPVMERLKFLGIFSSNMDEFFKVRVASISRRIELGKKGLADVLEVINHKSQELDERFQSAYSEIMSLLAKENIHILTEHDLEQQPKDVTEWVQDYFRTHVLPSLVPVILHKSQPFPPLTDGALYLGVVMTSEKLRYAILEIPADLPRFILLPNGNIMYLDDVIRFMLNDIFYIFKYDRIAAYEFKISRDAELDMDNDFSEGYVRKMEKVLKQRKGGRPVRLVYDAAIAPGLRQILLKELKISEDDPIIAGGRYHNMKDLIRFPNHRPDLSFEKMEPAAHPVLNQSRTPMLKTIRKQDILVTYPYQSFDHLVRLLREAAIDPNVKEIRMTLYRVADRSQVVNALVNAARNGKRIFVCIELQARFDERHNIHMSERLVEAGAQVVYGVPPFKVHGKLLLIKTENGDFVGLSTGNYNESTGRLYVDSLLLSADKRLTEEVERIFNFLESAAQIRTIQAPKFKHLLVSPFNARKTLLKYLARETQKGTDGYVFIKVNHLTDTKFIARIQEAAEAGVKMDLVVRTTYAMVPQDNIRAISILDRFLEHQRVYIFGQGNDRCVFMSSADLMERNLDWRVEVAFPVYDKKLQQEVADIMALQTADTTKARILDQTQSNPYVNNGQGPQRAQYDTYRHYCKLAANAVTKPMDS